MENLAALANPERIAAAKAVVTPANLALALIALNFFTFAAFGIDKDRAERGTWRISEGTLLRLAFFGGTPGAYAVPAQDAQAAVLRQPSRHRGGADHLCSRADGRCVVRGRAGALIPNTTPVAGRPIVRPDLRPPAQRPDFRRRALSASGCGRICPPFGHRDWVGG